MGTKSETRVTLRLLSNIIGNSNDKTIFPHKLLLTDRRVPKICKALANNSSVNTRLSKSQLSKKYCNQEDFLVDLLDHY